MSNGITVYRLDRPRLEAGLISGFNLTESGDITSEEGTLQRYLLLPALDSATPDCPWGRFTFRAEFFGEAVLTVRAFASNETVFLRNGELASTDGFLLDPAVPLRGKAALFEASGGIHRVGARDLLLYGLTGRFLWLWVEVVGTGSARLEEFRVLVPGDNFYRTFPALYQNEGEFFHRYLSIFSTLYADLQDTIDRLPAYLDLDTAPAEALPIFARWLGLELDGNFLDEGHLRRLLKLAPELIACKGTRRAIELVVGLFVEEPVYLVERNLLDPNQLAEGGTLYGSTPYDFTLLIARSADELLHARLQFLVDQFKPLRSRGFLVFLGDKGGLDAFSYLDLNAALLQHTPGSLDHAAGRVGSVYLT